MATRSRPVTARFLDKAGSPGDVVATLHDGKRPDTDDDVALATLSGDNPDTAGEYTFTRYGEGCALAADATRFARFSSTNSTDNNNEYRWNTVLNGFGQTTIPSDNGWTIADELDHRIGSDALAESQRSGGIPESQRRRSLSQLLQLRQLLRLQLSPQLPLVDSRLRG